MQIEQNLFSTPEQIAAFKTLQKIPYKIRLSFQDLTGEQHHLLVTDWEICILFLNECKRLGSEENALASVKHKIEQEIFGIKNDVYLILGSVFAHLKQDTLVVIGFVYPKKDPKQVLGMESLFG